MIATSWGRYPSSNLIPDEIYWPSDPLPVVDFEKTILPYGMGRSYGDSCLNLGNKLLSTRKLDRFIQFDASNGYLRVEAGVTLEAIINLVLPHGWFLPVVPGTKFVTVGGAVANDIHGKNHHRVGSFGHHVLDLKLRRSDGKTFVCSPNQETMLFHATIGGLGLTGLITEVGLQLRPVKNGILDVETLKFKNLNELFSLTEQTDLDFEYTVAWIDSLATGSEVGRGHLIRANHNQTEGSAPISTKKPLLNVPFDMPKWVLNPLSIKAFNTLYYQKQQAPMTSGRVLYNPFFFPLDGVGGWNRFYGKPGFLQYQCVIPFSERSAVEEILRKIASSKSASFLSVLKNFGYKESLGLLSFPKPGITLALDFSNRGEKTFLFLEELDKIVQSAGGRLYPAKDARMSPATFQTGFPRWREFVAFIDPRFSSSFWRRVTAPNNLQMLSARGAF